MGQTVNPPNFNSDRCNIKRQYTEGVRRMMGSQIAYVNRFGAFVLIAERGDEQINLSGIQCINEMW